MVLDKRSYNVPTMISVKTMGESTESFGVKESGNHFMSAVLSWPQHSNVLGPATATT